MPGRGRPIKLKLGDLVRYASPRKIGRPRKYPQITSVDVGKLERVRRWLTIDRQKADPRAPAVTMREIVFDWLKYTRPGVAHHRLQSRVSAYCVLVSRARGAKARKQRT